MNRTKCFKILELHPSASSDDIKLAYKRMAMQYHPDRGGDADYFKQINTAYQILSTADAVQPRYERHKDERCDLHFTLPLTWAERNFNTHVTVYIPHKEWVSDSVTSELNINITKCKDGDKLRLKYYGNYGGDCILHIVFEPFRIKPVLQNHNAVCWIVSVLLLGVIGFQWVH